jgi:hypothetical protein
VGDSNARRVLQEIMKLHLFLLTCCLNAFAACPATIFVTGNSPAATTARSVLIEEGTGRPFMRPVANKNDAEAILDVASSHSDGGTAVSGTLTDTKSSDLIWSGGGWFKAGMNPEGVASRIMLDKVKKVQCIAEEQEWKKNKKKK